MQVSQLFDSEDIYRLEKQINETSEALSKLVPEMGKAKQIIEFASDQRKRALAKSMVQWIAAGDSASAAEAKGRASFVYGEELAELSKQLREAETVKANWEATRIMFESARSLLALQRQMTAMT